MDDDSRISAEGISKKFTRSLGHSIRYGAIDIARNMAGFSSDSRRLRANEFWAVDEVSFELKKGETLGIIGSNGAGKSTVLKLLNGIFLPDKGRIAIRGRVGALIEVGAGFHPLLTGRENIYVNGSILGMTRREIDERFDSIVEFADIGDFIDSPVKYYSSGMYVRLGFAVAIHCDPDILLVDEILAVGDRDFQLKCFQKIHQMIKDGVSLILISHNAYAMRAYTERCVVLKRGREIFSGKTEDALTFYMDDSLAQRRSETIVQVRKSDAGNSKNNIRGVHFYNKKMEKVDKVASGDTLIVDLEYEVSQEVKTPIFGINFLNRGILTSALVSPYDDSALPPIQGKGVARLTVERLTLPVDVYGCSVTLYSDSLSNPLVWRDLPHSMVVARPTDALGEVELGQKWELLP